MLEFKVKENKKIESTPQVVQETILKNLKQNSYLVLANGTSSLINFEDDDSDRKSSKMDYYTRIESGYFELKPSKTGTHVRLVYVVSPFLELVFIFMFTTVGIFDSSIIPLIFSSIFGLNFFMKIWTIRQMVFKQILEAK